MNQKQRKLRIAILACDVPDGIPRQFRNKSRGISEILKMRLLEIARYQKVNADLTVLTFSIPKRPNEFPDPHDFQAIVVSGSMADISFKYLLKSPWMKNLQSYIRDMHDEVPTLGICFGSQAIGTAYDSHIEDLPVPEEGFIPCVKKKDSTDDPVFYNMPERFLALFSHGQYITPSPGVVLVESDSPSIQAFRIGKQTWGIQFHPDFAPETVRSALIARRWELSRRGLDVAKALARLDIPDDERIDTKPLVNFVKFAAGIPPDQP